ncbi:hypothetical protein FJY69_07350 [candidate division WOR-3 bacterium]|nr:hypothetical protein [candidate division WOR-3 bacterium]
MPTNPAQRIAKWNAKFNTERIKGALDDMRPTMFSNVQAVFPLITAMELQVKQVLDLAGVSSALYAMYLSFARELWHLGRIEMTGEAAAVEAELLIVKWVARTLTRSVLETIRTGVFNIGPPSSP